MHTPIVIYTDGACKGNGKASMGAGGYGVYIQYPDGRTRHLWGGESESTNNRMELMAAIIALQTTDTNANVQLWTDSVYVKNGISQWIHGWKKKNWKKADGKPVANQTLWQQLDALASARQVDWHWVKGHTGDVGNEMADKLANEGVVSTGDVCFDAHGVPLTVPQINNPINITAQHITPSHTNDFNNNPKTTPQTTMTEPSTPIYDGDTSRANPHFVPSLPAPINRGRAERQLIMDTETTGFDDQNGDRIVEVGMIEMVGRKFTGEKLHVYLNPEKLMDDEVIKVHGISNEFVADKPKFSDVAAKIYEFTKGAELIAHNAVFDMRFLKMEFERAGYPDFDKQVTVVDTLLLAKQMYPGQRNSLDALVKRLDVGKKDRTFHGALLDSEILAEVYLAMTGGQVALDIDEGSAGIGDLHTHENLSHLASMLIRAQADQDADAAWRASVLN